MRGLSGEGIQTTLVLADICESRPSALDLVPRFLDSLLGID